MGEKRGLTLEQRFWSHVDKRSMDECWNWIGSLDTLGRGSINVNGRTKVAPRIGYFLYYGIEPDEYCVLHKCDNPACVNPNHLYLGTQKDNAQDRKIRNRAFYGIGDKSRVHKLTQTKANIIRKIYKPRKFSAQKIANIFGVSKKCILNVIHNRTWSNHIIHDMNNNISSIGASR